MGYTHYWRREPIIQTEDFKGIVDDFKKLVPELRKMGVELAGGHGDGNPTVNNEEVWFNGKRNCGHEKFDLHIAWPSEDAGGIGVKAKEAVKGTWFAGAKIQTRVCGGDCSHETFWFPRVREKANWDKPEIHNGLKLYFSCTKTAFKPYDLAVNCFLIIAKYHLRSRIIVHSDGEKEHWFDGMLLCHKILGYGLEFKLDK